MKTIFIAQAWHGRTEDEIIAERNAVADRMRAFGEVEVIPSAIDAVDSVNGCVAVRRLAQEVALLSEADAAVFAPGWEGSRGCRALHQICVGFGIETTELSPAALETSNIKG